MRSMVRPRLGVRRRLTVMVGLFRLGRRHTSTRPRHGLLESPIVARHRTPRPGRSADGSRCTTTSSTMWPAKAASSPAPPPSWKVRHRPERAVASSRRVALAPVSMTKGPTKATPPTCPAEMLAPVGRSGIHRRVGGFPGEVGFGDYSGMSDAARVAPRFQQACRSPLAGGPRTTTSSAVRRHCSPVAIAWTDRAAPAVSRLPWT